MKKIDFNQTIYGIDIETSTVHLINGKQYFFNGFNYENIKNKNDKLSLNAKIEKSTSYMISYCISKIVTWNGSYSEYSKGRTYVDLDNDLEYLNKTSNGITLIYAHNFSYEFSFFINNLKFFKNCDGFYMSKNKPLNVKCGNLEFRCSYLLLNKSISKLGSELELPKLDFEYNKIRTPLNKMSEKEWRYNFRDVEIMLKSIYKLMIDNPYIESVRDIPLTKTGISRINCKENSEINQIVEFTDKNDKIKKSTLYWLQQFESEWEKAKDEKQLDFWERLFKGGFVYSNPKYCGQVQTNIMSFDFSSDYPYQMLYRNFPRNFNEIKIKSNKWKYFNQVLLSSNSKSLIEKQPYKYMINCVVKLEYVKAKYSILPLAITNIDERLKNGIDSTIINGKIKEINREITMYLSHIDVIILKLFYDFIVKDIVYLEKATKITPSSSYRINCVLFNGRKKSEYKVYKELIENTNDFKYYEKSEINDDFIRKNLNKCKTFMEQVKYINQSYLRVKSDLNSLYGDNAQHLNRPNIFYDFDDKEFKVEKSSFNENYKNRKKKTSYIYGLYVPAYARASILFFAYEFAKQNVDTLYIDTDSLKIKDSDYKIVKNIIDDYNNLIKTEITDCYNLDFGMLEFEHTFSKFCTMGCKSYVYILNGNVYATISGLPKASELYQQLYKMCNNDFDELINRCYHLNVCIESTVTNKLCAIYSYKKSDMFVNGYRFDGYSGCVLKPVNLVMQDTHSKTWSLQKSMLEDIYKLSFNDKPTMIKKNEKGELIIC